MNVQAAIELPDALAKLREPFPPNQISKLPKESKAQAEQRKADRNNAINCKVCGGWHHKNAVHLDYVGHAALTDRLLDTDPLWSWEPMAFDNGLPAFDRFGGLWINLTVCGVTRPGYGSADGKTGGDAVKEIIGDALRNAAMRFGAALDLWHKGDLHLEDGAEAEGSGRDNSEARQVSPTGPATQPQGMPDAEFARLVQLIEATSTDRAKMLKHFGVKDLRFLNQAQYGEAVAKLTADLAAMAKQETNQQAAGFGEILNDEIVY